MKRGRKPNDATVKPNVLQDFDLGQKVVASIQGTFAPEPTAVAELIAPFIQLGRRLPKRPLPPSAMATLHSLCMEQAGEAELPARVDALARDLATALCSVRTESLPDLLRQAADVIESRPLKPHRDSGLIVLTPADKNVHAATWLTAQVVAKRFPSGVQATLEIIRELIQETPFDERLRIMREGGAEGDDQTLTRALHRFVSGLRLRRPGRPRKSGK